MNKFIAFSGLDGAGKSTQIELLAKYYEDNNRSVFVFWSRGGYTPGFVLLKKVLRTVSGKRIPKSGHSVERDKAIANLNIQRIWLNVALLDLIYYYSIYLRIQKVLFRKTIICDRYIYDTYIDFKLSFPKQNFEKWILWKILNTIALKPLKHYVLLINVDESQIRSKQKNEPFPDSAETLENRLNYYKNYLKLSNGIYINGISNKMEIHKRIITEINEK